MAFTVYVRYKQILILTSGREETRYCKPANVNKYSFKFGLVASLGISIVGNFQETNVFIVHVIGALMAFVVGCVYLFTQVRHFHLSCWTRTFFYLVFCFRCYYRLRFYLWLETRRLMWFGALWQWFAAFSAFRVLYSQLPLYIISKVRNSN